ncbi:CGNR zinc finger domain-containing protein [Adhaeribacter radiodurans]|uniref:CGNR zinc finger domain-containing protein n=1 Tax=Adhaeribacter radiodurans TaxID=2745197 RepID=A0A7L7L8F6_9BACT|nr:CGNR zinc finger domain-containing protein [Adhaeribacter radiodurans]QMU29097.1 CGNR zinc finger domain-containing protein [Adhaeribacter radiodurans]
MAHQNTIETIPFDGGVLCLDFINTIRNRKVTSLHNYLATYQNFIIWCSRIQQWPEEWLNNLYTYSQEQPAKAKVALHNILATRENMYAIFSAIAAEAIPDAGEIAIFNQHLTTALSQVALTFENTQYTVLVRMQENDLERPLKTILYSAYQTLTQTDRKKIKECAECGWLFLDTTKNGKRQWCNPGYCGSTSKARRYYHRKKGNEQK